MIHAKKNSTQNYFWPKKILTQKNFRPKFFWPQKISDPIFFVSKKFLTHKNFRPKKISYQHFFDPKKYPTQICLAQKIPTQQNFWPKFCSKKIQTKIFFTNIFMGRKKIGQHLFCLYFHQKFIILPNNIEVRMKTTTTKSTYISKTI